MGKLLKNQWLWVGVSIAFAIVSAGCWFWSATITAIPMGGIGGTPPEVVDGIYFQGKLNGIAAICAGIAALCQATASFIQKKYNAFQ